jgi:hypothetical protein
VTLSSVAMVLAVVFLIMLVQRSSGSSGLGDEVRYFPEETRIIVSFDVRGTMRSIVGKKLLASKSIRELEQNMAGMAGEDPNKLVEKAIGLTLDDIDRVTVAARFDFDGPRMRGEGPDVVVVLKAANAGRFNLKGLGAPEFRDESVGRYTLKDGGGFAYCIADSGTIVMAPTPTLRRVLTRGAPPPLSPGMREAMGQADFSNALTVALNIKDLQGREKDMFDKAFPPDTPPVVARIRDAAEGAVVQLRADSNLDIRATLLCKDAAKATEISKELNGLLDELRKKARDTKELPEEALKVIDALKFSSNGNAVKIGVRIDFDGILRLLEEQLDQERVRRQQWEQRFRQEMEKGRFDKR